MPLEIRVNLPADRTKTGTIALVDTMTGLPIFGPVPAFGRAARNTAGKHGNPKAAATLPFGDTPTGSYRIPYVLKSGDGTTHPKDVYGSAGVIALDPVSGQALTAKGNGRVGLAIHAGRQIATPTPMASHLKPTNGCVRMLEGDLAHLIKAMKDYAFLFPGDVVVSVADTAGPAGEVDNDVDDGDPPNLLGPTILP